MDDNTVRGKELYPQPFEALGRKKNGHDIAQGDTLKKIKILVPRLDLTPFPSVANTNPCEFTSRALRG